MASCDDCGQDYTDELDGGTCQVCDGKYCDACYGDHACLMQEDQDVLSNSNDQPINDEQILDEDEEDPPDWLFDTPLQLHILPEEKKQQDPPEVVTEKTAPLLPLARGLNLNRIDEDYRKVGVATWNLHGLNDRRSRGETYDKEISNRLKALRKAVGDVIAVIRGTKAVDQPIKSRLRQTKKKLKTAPTAAKVPVTDEEVAKALADSIADFWPWVALRDSLQKLNQAPAAATIQDLLARLQKLFDADCSVTTAAECIRLRTATRRIVGSEGAWKKAAEGRGEQQWAVTALVDPRKRHPLCPVLDALVALDQSLNTHLVIKHINQLMAKNPWLDAFILQEVRPDGLKVLKEQLDKSLRLTFGPCMAGVAKTLNQREYYPVVTRTSTISKVGSYAIACVKDQWTEPAMPKKSKAKRALWTLDDDEDLGVDVYRGVENGEGALDTVNVLWSKERKVYRPVVVYELTTADGPVTIGNVHTSPGDGDDEWWRHHEYDQLETAFEAGGKDGFWLMGGDYYLSAEARVLKSDADLEVTELEDSATYDSVVELYEGVTSNTVDPDTSQLTIGQAQQAIFSAHSTQQRPSLYILEKDYTGELRSEQVVHQPFVPDLRAEVADTKRLDGNAASEDVFRNVLRLTFEKTLPVHWKIAQAISGSNTHLKIHDFPAYATSPGKIPIDCIERARRFTRARVTSKMRIADFFIFNQPWHEGLEDASLACKVGLLAPVEVGGGAGIHWYDEEDLAISRYWLAISDHFPVGGVFTTDPRDPVLKTITAAPFMAAPVKPSTQPALAPDSEKRFALLPMPQDGDCFFEGVKAALGLNETADQIRQHALLEDSKISKTYVGWPDWEAVAKHYGVTIAVHEYSYGEPDRFMGLLPEVNPNQAATVHLRLIHVQDQSASHMDLLVPL